MARPLRIGVLALQGAFREHAHVLRRLGAEVVEVRLPEDLDGVDGLVIPGGESTTITSLAEEYGLDDAIRAFDEPILGTCAGMIVLDREHLGLADLAVERNAYGRQVRSFEADVALADDERPLRGVFIRAPRIRALGPEIEVLGTLGGEPVLVRDDRLLLASFHPELTDDTRVHARFLELVREALRAPRLPGASLASETSERREGQYTDVRPSDASAVSRSQRRQAAAEAGSAGREPVPAGEAGEEVTVR